MSKKKFSRVVTACVGVPLLGVVTFLTVHFATAPRVEAVISVTDAAHIAATQAAAVISQAQRYSQIGFLADQLSEQMQWRMTDQMRMQMQTITRQVQAACGALTAIMSLVALNPMGEIMSIAKWGEMAVKDGLVHGFDPSQIGDMIMPSGRLIAEVLTADALPRALIKLKFPEDFKRLGLPFDKLPPLPNLPPLPPPPPLPPLPRAFNEAPRRMPLAAPWFVRVANVPKVNYKDVLRYWGMERKYAGVNPYERDMRQGAILPLFMSGEPSFIARPAVQGEDLLQKNFKSGRLVDRLKVRAYYSAGDGFSYDPVFGDVKDAKPELDIDNTVSMGAREAMESAVPGMENPYRGFTRKLLPLVLAKAEKGGGGNRIGITADEMQAYIEQGGIIPEEDEDKYLAPTPQAVFQTASGVVRKSGVPMVRTGIPIVWEGRQKGGKWILSIGSGLSDKLIPNGKTAVERMGLLKKHEAFMGALGDTMAKIIEPLTKLQMLLTGAAGAANYFGVDPQLAGMVNQMQHELSQLKRTMVEMQDWKQGAVNQQNRDLADVDVQVNRWVDKAEPLVHARVIAMQSGGRLDLKPGDTDDDDDTGGGDLRDTPAVSFTAPTRPIHPILLSVGAF